MNYNKFKTKKKGGRIELLKTYKIKNTNNDSKKQTKTNFKTKCKN